MYKVGMCGLFGEGEQLLNGQTVKTKMIYDELGQFIGANNIHLIDTYKWKRNPLKLFVNCFLLMKRSKNIIILPAQNGIKVIPVIFLILNVFFKRKMHYVVIGGWLPEVLEKNKLIKNVLFKYHGIYVETNSMVEKLNKIGLKNAIYLPNFKRLTILSKESLEYIPAEPLKVCTFSRVMKEKGIEDAIYAIESINKKFERTVFTLDIFGQIESDYKERFLKLESEFPDYIKYCGLVNAKSSVKVLKKYSALLFPTYYKGEGFAGTIIDAFASGIPVIATDWRYNKELIEEGFNGFTYKNNDELIRVLVEVATDPTILNSMKENCLKTAEIYFPDNVIPTLIKQLE